MKHTGKKLLVVAPDFPYPPNHGGRVDTWGRIKTLAELGFIIDLVVTEKGNPNTDDIDVVKKYIDNLFLCKRDNRIIDVFSLKPLQIKSREELTKIKFNRRYDFVILETQYVFPIMNNITLHTDQYILRLQNDETIYFKELSKSIGIGWKKLYYLLESFKFKWIEPKVIKDLKNILFISQDEMSMYQKRYPELKCIFLPPPISKDHYQLDLNSRKVLFVGSLFMINNKDALKWYIKKVHSLLNDIEGYEFIIAGNSRRESLEWLYKLIRGEKNIYVYDSPKSLTEFYKESCVFVNPMLHGAGIKLKTIEGITNGLPVVSTTVGNQGTGLMDKEHIMIADDPQLYASYIRELLLNTDKGKKIVQNAQSYLLKHYNQKVLLEEYFSTLMKG